MYMRRQRILAIFALAGLLLNSVSSMIVARAQAAEVRAIVFPVLGSTSFGNDFGDPRSGGRVHEGNDILGAKMQPLISAVDGEIAYVAYPEPDWGFSVYIRDRDGYQYRYLHMNNDTPGTDDGRGGGMLAYAPDIMPGNPVVKGQLIGWMGDSGNAEGTRSHLHFEIRQPGGNPINPYESLLAAERRIAAVPRPPMPAETLPYGELEVGAAVAVGNFDNTPTMEFVTGPGPGGGPHVRTFDGNVVLSSPDRSSDHNHTSQSLTISRPLGLSSGDVMLAAIATRSSPLISAPFGWIMVRNDVISGNLTQAMYTKTASGNEPSSYTWTFSQAVVASGGILSFDDVDATNPVEAHGGEVSETPSFNIVAPALTTRSPNMHVVGFFSSASDTHIRPPQDMTERWDEDSNEDTLNVTIEAADMLQTTAGNTGTKEAVANNEAQSIGQLVALRIRTTALNFKPASFYAYAPGFIGGIDVAAGDVDGDGVDEIVTAAGPGGGPHVRIFKADGTPVGNGFMAYDPGFVGGVRVSAGDVDGDGKAEIITGAGPGGGPHVRVFRADGTPVLSFFAYNANFRGGIDVGAADGTIATGPGVGGGPHVRVFDKSGNIKSEFMAYDPLFSGGIRVATAEMRFSFSGPEIVTSPASGGGPDFRMFSQTGEQLDQVQAFEEWWIGGFEIGAGDGRTMVASGPGGRRASVRAGPQ